MNLIDIYIDESATNKQAGHATIALVYLEVTNMELFENAIQEIENELGIRYFHWSDERWKTREAFMTKLLKLDFKLKVAILENPVKLSQSMEDALKHLVIEQNIRKIVIDGRKPKWYSQKIKKVLRDKGISVKKIVTIRKDESSPGVRVADCLAGLVRYYHDNPESMANQWYNKLKKNNKILFELTSFKP